MGRLYNVPLEAWTVKGVSSITSSLGKPIMMDRTTARMCHMGTGNIGYARVLVEIKAEKELKDKIEIVYKGKNTECDGNNGSGKGNFENSKGVNVSEEVTRMNRNKKDNAGMGNKKGPVQNRGKEHVWQKKTGQQDDRMAEKGKTSDNNTKSPGKMWKTSKETVEELRKSANKYAVFCDIGDTEVLEEQVLSNKEIVEKYVKNHKQPGLEEEARWTP
ncbi:hypothetical protein CTI12_AA002340 [Artemisia annua]|uniref:DUF4283 domain-containing protein n=1 Tax=Artemisia annua TaxID=35608 RepID=A0A2U1QNX0_ARTAN|nr:hypothetical protein CTI12_AA002340 [Artemisia annua]